MNHCHLMDCWHQLGLPPLVPLTVARLAGLHATKHMEPLEESHGVQQSLWHCQGGGNVMSRHLKLLIQEKVWLPSNMVFKMFENQKNGYFWWFGYLLGIRKVHMYISFRNTTWNHSLTFESTGKNYMQILTGCSWDGKHYSSRHPTGLPRVCSTDWCKNKIVLQCEFLGLAPKSTKIRIWVGNSWICILIGSPGD